MVSGNFNWLNSFSDLNYFSGSFNLGEIMDKILEKQMGRDLKEIDLTEDYEKDLVTIQRCINAIYRVREERTLQYEKDLRAI